MKAKKVLLVKYGEISLRKGNRGHAERGLISIIKKRLEGEKGVLVKREQGRFVIESDGGDLDTEAVLARIRRIFGIVGFCHALKTDERDPGALAELARGFFAENAAGARSFRVSVKRGDKSFPLMSNELAGLIGEAIRRTGCPVDLRSPEANLHVEIRTGAYLYFDSEAGEGGLPYGSSGKGVLLLSGGFDSPVAGFLAARRGIEILPVYFHTPPYVSEMALAKVKDICGKLAGFTGAVSLLEAPFTELQMFLRDSVQREKLTIMTKRAMLRMASMYADAQGAGCLVTGDSVGQVASQTVASLHAVNSASAHAILRPCAALDKREIIGIAQRIGTADISKLPYDDCCTLFLAKHPEIRPKAAIIERIEARLMPALAPLLDGALAGASLREFG